MIQKRSIILALLTAATLVATHAQQTDYEKTPEQQGGVYYAYPIESGAAKPNLAPALEGYEVFYISHYGRHGSRWLTSDHRYIWVNQQFSDEKNLTKLGKSVRKRLAKIWKNAKGNGGKLTPLGGRQHRGIACRMHQNFPQLFTKEAHLTAHSSTADRCRASMLNFLDELNKLARLDGLEKLEQLEPITREEDMAWIAYASPEQKALENRTRVPLKVSTDRFIRSLFIDPSKVENPVKLLTELHTIASDMQDVELNVSLYDIFTKEELEAVYAKNNESMTFCHGDVILNEGIPARSAISLWQHIEADADAAIARGGVGADLRFGHDTNLYRLLTLMQVDTKGKPMDEILPMAANLQMIFYKNAKGKVIIQMLHNEQSVGFWDWDELKQQVHERIHYLEHLRQLNAINTMVGTAPANTKTAGLFGKGSEEHGQTLPAVLAPNGQNFWTPQTRDTEKKCIAPYYYTDSLLQGFRNSHWIVGGCTQDYGSFTLAALTGKLRLKPTERATRFSHAEEISHPHYYAVRLPDEHLTVEMTGSSHTAIFRITPEQDGPVHIVINHNSDEGEGDIYVDTTFCHVYGYNPVHRIYQGWGESAGFSGHFILDYSDPLIDYGKDDACVWLTFDGHAHEKIILYASTSFTSKEGAQLNKDPESVEHSFDDMVEDLSYQWAKRLHTIDIEDPDTARVNQFYGALYRASFLPREFSDVDGSYPRFANSADNSSLSSLLSPQKYFTDFSMWDTYRAVHPLLNIIAPSLSSQMMQSLVTMAEQGGWMPIFPCWNSYTAAMIGDHCASVLADAYVKGIENIDYATAYRYLRQNAFNSPTPEQYKNGMGRRALQSYLKYGYIPLEDHVPDAFHTDEQTSRTLEYAYDDFCVAQLARDFGTEADYRELMRRSENWRNVINPSTGWADGRHADGSWENNSDLTHRKSYITEGATCHYTWYVPHNIPGLIEVMGGPQRFEQKLDTMFNPTPNAQHPTPNTHLYWHGNEPCHQIAYLYNFVGRNDNTRSTVRHILDTEYNNTPGGLSGNDDAGQMSSWYIFSSLGFYPVCPGTPNYELAAPTFQRATFNLENGRHFTIERNPMQEGEHTIGSSSFLLNGQPLHGTTITHNDILRGGTLVFTK